MWRQNVLGEGWEPNWNCWSLAGVQILNVIAQFDYYAIIS